MSNAINKANVYTALMNALQPGLNTSREVDRVMAAINKGEFDLVYEDGGVDADGNSEDYEFGRKYELDPKAEDESFDEWVSRMVHYAVGAASVAWGGGTKGVFDEGRASSIASELLRLMKMHNPGPVENSLAGELDAIKALSEDTQRFVDSAHGPGEYLVTDWALAITVRYLQGEQEKWAAGLPEMVTYATEPSGSIVAEIGALQTIHERLVRIAAGGNHLAKGE